MVPRTLVFSSASAGAAVLQYAGFVPNISFKNNELQPAEALKFVKRITVTNREHSTRLHSLITDRFTVMC